MPGGGTEYRLVAVVSAPVFGHVKCIGTPMGGRFQWALPLEEIVGLESDSYAVLKKGE